VTHFADCLNDRLERNGIALADLVTANLELALRTDALPTIASSPFDCHCGYSRLTTARCEWQVVGYTWYDCDKRSAA
jgi:hypothetical protein